MKWKLVVFDGEDASHTTYSNREGTIDSFRHIVDELVSDPDSAAVVWSDLSRIGARYAEWSYATFVLVSYDG